MSLAALSVEWILTLTGLGLAAVLFGLAIWQSGRPRKDSLRARWIPWRFVILLAGVLILVALVHITNMLGVHTGQNNYGRP